MIIFYFIFFIYFFFNSNFQFCLKKAFFNVSTFFFLLIHSFSIFLNSYFNLILFRLPCIESYTKVDMRTVSFDVPPQEVSFKQFENY